MFFLNSCWDTLCGFGRVCDQHPYRALWAPPLHPSCPTPGTTDLLSVPPVCLLQNVLEVESHRVQTGFFHLVFAPKFPSWLESSFLFHAESHSTVWMDRSFIYLSPTDGHLGCVHVLAVMNKAAQASMCRFLCGHDFLTPLGKCQGTCLLDAHGKEYVQFCNNRF